jgi:hypothetical protein
MNDEEEDPSHSHGPRLLAERSHFGMGFNIWIIIGLVVIVVVLLIIRKKQAGG